MRVVGVCCVISSLLLVACGEAASEVEPGSGTFSPASAPATYLPVTPDVLPPEDEGVPTESAGDQRGAAVTTGAGAPIGTASPADVTGVTIGSRIDPSLSPPGTRDDGSIDVSLTPEWIAAGRDGFVVGYLRKSDLYSPPDSGDGKTPPGPSPPPLIYNNEMEVIGTMTPEGVKLDTDP